MNESKTSQLPTVESLQEKILSLNGKVTELTTVNESLTSANTELTGQVENLRTLNQKYFLQLSQEPEKVEATDNKTEENIDTIINKLYEEEK